MRRRKPGHEGKAAVPVLTAAARMLSAAARFALSCQPNSAHIRGHGEDPRPAEKARQIPEIQSRPPRRSADRAGAGGTVESRDQSRRRRHRLVAPGCSRRPTIPGIAAPAARRRRIAPAPRRAGRVMMSRREIRRRERPRGLPPPNPPPHAGEGSGEGGDTEHICCRGPPPPTPLPQGGGEQTAQAVERARERSKVSTKPRKPITAPRPPSRRSIRNWRGSSACRPPRMTTRRWRGRRAARWKRSASRPPRTRWRT